MKNKMLKSFAAKLLAVACAFSMFASVPSLNVKAADATLLNTYGSTYGYSGTCINLYQLRDSKQLSILKRDYNSITLENEMKPDALLGSSARLISVSQAKNQGYYIPDNYREQYVPQINFNTVDEVMKICYQNGLKMRAHTLVWHSQTPSWFFRSNFNGGSGFVNSSVMDARLEMYVKTVMNHVYTNQYGSVVYAWDVANEILHAQNSGWEAVYGNNKKNASYVKKAFNYAYETLEYFKLTDSVKLFYNDYNTYMEVNDVITLVNYINQGKKVCAGVGMQSHLGTNYPSVDYYTTALNSFLRAGFEVQITELDITNKGDSDMANYAYNLFKNINKAKKNGGKITGVTWWGLSDQTTWINNSKPLLFSTPGNPKQAYSKVLQAYTEVIGQPGSNPQPTPTPQPTATPTPTPTPTATPVTGDTVANGWYYIKDVNSQKYLTVEGNEAKAVTNVCISTGTGVQGQKWYVESKGNGYVTLKSGLGDFMLDLANGVDENNANIQIYNAYGHDAQQFVLKSAGTNGVFYIGTKVSNGAKVVDVTGGRKTDGTNVCQYAYNGRANQQWAFESVNGGSQAQPTPTPVPTAKPTPTPTPAPTTQPSQEASTSGLTVSSSVNNWGSGYQVSVKLENKTGKTVDGWTLKVKKSEVNITSSWNMTVKTDGDYYVITPVDWNKTVLAGQSVDIGFMGSGSVGNTVNFTVQ